MAYVALYRKWRPQDFENLVGQEHVSKTLANAIETGKIAHAYLFAGPRGTGKTSTAKIMAKALNCEHGPTTRPCNHCHNCEKINAGTSMDVFEIDAASNRGIDEIRDLRETVKFAPVEGRYKVYIIDEVHMLTTEAFNALLKTLEEPPAHVVFILATTEPHRIPATIHSRCQRYDFHRISVDNIQARLAEVAAESGLKAEADALRLIAAQADGGLRDALSILDQCAAFTTETITAAHVRQMLGLVGHEGIWKLTDLLADRDSRSVLLAFDELIMLGKDARQIVVELALHIRSLMLYKAAPDLENIELYSDDRTVLAAQCAKFKHDELVYMLDVLHRAANEAKWAPEPRIAVEMALLSLCRRQNNADLAALTARVAALEAKLAQVEASPNANAVPVPKVQPPKVSPMPARNISVQNNNNNISPDSAGPTADRALAAQNVPAVTASEAPVVPADVKAVWDAVLKELIASGKRSVHACVAQGHLVFLNNKQATIQFAAAFPKERTEKEDYKAIIEKVFAHVCGTDIRVHCTLGAAAPPRAVSKPPVPAAPGVQPDSVTKAEHPVLRQALMMFGGKVIQQDKTEEE